MPALAHHDRATLALRFLATAVDADAGAHLYLDRGDGVLDLVATVSGEAGRPDGATSHLTARASGLLRRLLGGKAMDPVGAVARLILPEARGGVLVLERRRCEPFSDDDLAIARVQARHLAGEVVTRLVPRPMAWSAQLEAVQSVAAQLTRLTSVEAVSAALCTQAHRVVSFDNARVYVLDHDGVTLQPVAFRSHAREYQGESVDGLRLRVGEGITGWVAATGQPLIVHDAARDPRALDVPGTLDLTEESMLLAPLRSEGRIIGVVVLSRLGLHRFTDDELRLLGVLADQAAVAIENARLLADRDRHVAELAALLDISQASRDATNERSLAGLLAEKLRLASGLDVCLLSRWDEETGQLAPIGASGLGAMPGAADVLAVDAQAAGVRAAGARAPGGENVPRAVLPVRDVEAMRVTRRVLLSGEPQVLDPAHDDIDPLEAERLRLLGGSAALLVPLVAAGRVVGLVEFIDRREPSALRSSELALMRTMANQAATALENARLMRELRDAAETDLVTGVYSHRHLQDRLRQETARAARSHDPLSVVMVDLDDFKLVNDAHGHQAGDRVLRAIAGCLRASVRAGDVVARYGGDEFVVLMPDTAEREAQAVARRAAEAVAALRHPMADGTQIRVTCSVGLALHPRDGRSGRALLRAADAQMYEQKRTRSPAVGTAPRQADQATHLEREAVAVAGAVATAAIPVAAVPEGAVGRAPR